MAINKNKVTKFLGTLDPLGTHLSVHVATIPHNAQLEDLMGPHFFWRVAQRVKPFDIIRCVWEDGSRVVDLRVMGRDQRAESLLLVLDADKRYETPPVREGYALQFVNQAVGWRVMVEDTNRQLRAGFASALEAALWLQAGTSEEDKAKSPPSGVKPAGGSKGSGKPAQPAAADAA